MVELKDLDGKEVNGLAEKGSWEKFCIGRQVKAEMPEWGWCLGRHRLDIVFLWGVLI